MTQRSVFDLKVGESALIKGCGEGEFSCKLLTLGVLPKARVTVIRKAPFGGALYLKINGNHLAVRKDEAKSISIV